MPELHEIHPGAVVTDSDGQMLLVTRADGGWEFQETDIATVQLSGGDDAYRLRWLPRDTPVTIHRARLAGL